MTLYTSLLTAGTNSHQESSETANGLATDLISPGVIGAITNTSGVAPATGAFAANAQGSPNMTVAVSAGVGYVTATPTSQNSQHLRVRNTATANVPISANSSGSTKYDWLYIQVDASKAANPASDASDVATLVTSRSSSATTDNGTPPTYGTLLAVVTVANGFSTITNGNIADKRVRAVAVGGLNDTNGNEVVKVSATASAVNEVTVTNAATGNAPTISATGGDTNVPLSLKGKGTSGVQLELRTQTDNANSISSATTSGIRMQMGWGQVLGNSAATLTDTVTFPSAFTTVYGVSVALLSAHGSTTAATDITDFDTNYSGGALSIVANAHGISTTGFTATQTRSSGTFANTLYWGYSWIAWGV